MAEVTWIDVDDVLAVGNNDLLDAEQGGEFLIQVTSAANQWAYRRRQTAGYADAVAQAPSPDVKLGTALYAWHLYQQRGAASAATFEGFPEPVAFGADMGVVRQLLGIGRPRVA